MKNNLFVADIFNANWAQWQDTLFILLIVVIAALFLFIVAFLFLSNSRMEADGRRMAKRIAWYERQVLAKRHALEAEKAKSASELAWRRSVLKEKEAAAKKAAAAAEKARKQLQEHENHIKELLKTTEISKKELAEYQKREGTNVYEDIVVNIITEKTLEESKLIMDPGYADVKIPQSVTFDFAVKDITDYIAKKPKITFTEGAGHKPASYKVEDKTLALVYTLDGGKMKVTFKCGPAYGTRLCKHLPDNVSVAKFPYGLLWFTVTNEDAECSLELMKLLLDISYKIAKLGY
ncbi:MAG: hypothetical protein FWD39_05720 [Clostridiales bacterium]|nr:hypothetical protein [Clostridiales bacterium]